MTHEKAICEEGRAWYSGRSVRRGGCWKVEYTCPTCGKSRKWLRNFVGSKAIKCDGVQRIEAAKGGE